jgi:hypothetical protein
MRYTSKKVFVGLEGSGKSYLMAQESVENLYRNAKWAYKTGIPRPIRGNLPWSDKFYSLAESLQVPIFSWKNIFELPTFTECDLYIDELATYFDSRSFKDLPLDVRLWLAQAEKMGVEIVGAAQDFGQVDKSFRRLCKEVVEVRKQFGSRRPMATAPRVRFVWGMCLTWNLDPRSFDAEQIDMKHTNFLPNPFFLRRTWTEYFDTAKRVSLSEPVPMQHIVRKCLDPNCDYHHKGKVFHV